MRLIQVAKALNMSGQQLRRELMQVNFGVKPTDREIPDRLAQGIIRFLAKKYNITPIELPSVGTEDYHTTETRPIAQPPTPPVREQAPSTATPPSMQQDVKPRVHILRKLTLNQSAKAPRKPRGGPLKPRTKAEREELLHEAKVFRRRKRRTEEQMQIKRKEGIVELPESISVKELSEKIGIQVPRVIATLMKNGVMATINQIVDYDTAAIVAHDLSVQVRKSTKTASVEHLSIGNLEELLLDEPEHLLPRPPVVVVMGHVDHGKTTLLDAIRKTNVAAKEAGNITQRIGASEVQHGKRSITFLDTPGHEAFTAMRARGTKVTDIAILVVAADEGVKPTTIEAIVHVREAEVPIIVAITKMDLRTAQPDRIKGQLAEQNLQPREWGGETPVIACSAVSRQGIEDLLDAALAMADDRKLTANPNRPAVASVIESHLSSSLGPLATIIINAGTLKRGDTFVCGATWGKVKTLMNAQAKNLFEALPSAGVQVSGFQSVPSVGDILQVVKEEREARRLAIIVREVREREKGSATQNLMQRISEGKIQTLKIILKADAEGSIDALRNGISGLKVEGQIAPKIIHAAIGSVTEGDVMIAAASSAIVLGFNVPLSAHVEKIADEHGVKVQLYDVIYALLDNVQALLLGLIEPEEEERILGHLEVKGCFYRKRAEQTIGGRVRDGVIRRARFRILREEREVAAGRITSLRRVQENIKEAKEGSECGMKVECEEEIKVGDVLEAFSMEFRKKSTDQAAVPTT
jgi:translation initiation factor IF-2